ncbi:unnamed protein product [Periconia digitata]|uniref:Uncharacterized protein n=1 Tax=Periconia digitata TaxID=1303443 RepID=A0A9W4XW73_9PLEO|nr:unnamed protein product [Periconia digitata]
MQFTTIATLLGLAATGLAAPTSSASGEVAAVGLRSTEAVNTTPNFEKRKFRGGWCGLHMKIVDGDYSQATITIKDGEGNSLETTHKQEARGSILYFEFTKGLPTSDPINIQVGGLKAGLARIEYKDQDISTGGYNTQNANCKVGKYDQPNVYKDRTTVDLDCGFSC